MAADRDVTKLQEELLGRMESVPPLEEEPDFFTNPTTLIRYLKARNFNIDEAEKLLRATVEWRRERRPLGLDCRWCHDRPGLHSLTPILKGPKSPFEPFPKHEPQPCEAGGLRRFMGKRQVGQDEAGRPVVYSCFSQTSASRNTVEDALDHVIYVLENAKRTMGPGVTGWVFIVDCTGMSLPACNPKLGYGIGQVLSNHYPERLGHVICVNHSAVFQGVWRPISVFLDPNTVSKVNFVRSKTKMVELFRRHFSEDLVKWLTDEISLNKKRPLAASQKRFWEKPRDSVTSHDPRGCPSYVRDYLEGGNPRLFAHDCTGHKPHPNVLDDMAGSLGCAEGKSSDGGAPVEGCTDNDTLLDEDLNDQMDEIDIGEEYQISTDAKPLQM